MADARTDGTDRGHRDTLGESEGVVALFRTLIAAVVLIAPSAVQTVERRLSFYLWVGAAGLYSLVTSVLVYKRIRFPYQRVLFLVLDILWLTLLIHHFHGLQGGLFPLYYLTVVIGAMWFSLPGAIGAAALATIAYIGGMLLTEEPGRLYAELRYNVLPQALLLFLTAILSAYLAEAWHAERQRAEQHEEVLEQFRKQMDMAQELQKLVLPPDLPTIAGLELGVRTRQAAVVVGGDYYDAVRFGQDALGLVCADVSGKSVPGQLRLPLVKYAFRTCAELFREPTRVVEQMNRLLYDELPAEMFVSLMYVLFEPGTEKLTMAGQHCPPLRLAASTGEVTTVETKGVVLGVEPDIKFPTVEVPFAADDYLVLYTDGVIEAKDRRGYELEVGGLIRILSEATPESAQDLANWLFSVLEEYETGEKHDDLTIVVARRGTG